MRYRLQKATLIMCLALIAGQIACIPQDDPQNIVLTEDVLYLSGERVSLTGRVFETVGKVDDHGFYLDKDPNFSAPIVISLGPKEDGLGRFIGDYNSLEINTVYYFKSYVNVGGAEAAGQNKEFTTLNSRINSFHPIDGVQGAIVTIEGINFTQDTRVLIGGKEVSILSIKDETTIEARVPPIGDLSEVTITVEVQDTSMVFTEKFTYHFGKWELESTFFNNLQLYEAMWLKESNEFVFGLGAEDNLTLNLSIWSLDLTTFSWTDLNFSGASAARAPFNSSGYWGSGAESKKYRIHVLSSYFWHYSLGAFIAKPALNFQLYKSVGVELNGDLYVFGGKTLNFSFFPNTVTYRYQEITSTWEAISVAPIDITNDYPYFTHNNEAYFLQPDGIIWRYSPSTEQWDQVASYPTNVLENGAAVAFNGRAYIGLFNNSTLMWEWDIENNIWVEKLPLPGDFRDVNTAFFSHNDKAYFFRSKAGGGKFVQNPLMELWSLNPTQFK